MAVFAFDRDWTVDVNPHPHHEAVPLEWVRHLAHETDHAVYAIGNQDLAEEAAIPGVVDVVGMHPDDWDEWLGDKQPDGHYERFPTRRERLALIADLHPDARRVVVDDIDLSGVPGWEHYHAWEFVPAVERGEVDPSLPWANSDDHGPLADGGLRTTAGVVPTDAAHLRTWLADAETEAFRLRYWPENTDADADADANGDGNAERGEDRPRTELVVGLDPVPSSGRRPSARHAFRAVSVDRRTRFSVPFDSIEAVDAVRESDLPRRPSGETPAERAVDLRERADCSGHLASVHAALTLVEEGTGRVRADALAALRDIAGVRPEDCTPALPVLASLLRDGLASDASDQRGDTLAVLADVAAVCPADVAPYLDTVVESLSAEATPVRSAAARCLAPISNANPSDAVDAVPALEPLLVDPAAREHAAYALCRLAETAPAELRPLAPTLADVATDASLEPGPRLNATAALGRVTGEYPNATLDVVDDVAALLDSDHDRLRNNAVGLLGDVAQVHTDAVAPHAAAIASLLSVEDDYSRVNATAALARVAEDVPEAVRPHVPALRDRLDDSEAGARENACWALGYLRAEDAVDALREATDDEAERVRRRARWALDRL